MDKDLVELKIAVARMAEQILSLQKTVERQASHIEELVALTDKGKGAAWILIGMGTIAGAAASKLIAFLPYLAK